MDDTRFAGKTSAPASGAITVLLHEARGGNPDALNELMPLVYRELRRQAARVLRNEGRHPTMQPTVLVHEAYMQLARNQAIQWEDRTHFFAVAARMMRRVLVDHARARKARKRSNDAPPAVGFDVAADDRILNVLILDEALDRLSALDPRQGRVVELRVFAGLNVEESASVLDVSPRTVKADWQMARAWLTRELREGGHGGRPSSEHT